MNRLKTLRLNRILALVLTIAALMAGQQAWGYPTTGVGVGIIGHTNGSVYRYIVASSAGPSYLCGPNDGTQKQFDSRNSDSQFNIGNNGVTRDLTMTLNGWLTFANSNSATDVTTIIGSSFEIVFTSANYYITTATVTTRAGDAVEGCTVSGTYTKTLTIKIPEGTTFGTINLGIATYTPLNYCTISGIEDCYIDDGVNEPVPTVTLEGKTLRQDVDYTLSYTHSTTGGSVTVTGAGDYVGRKSQHFNTREPNLSDLHSLGTNIYEIATQQDLDYLARIVKGKLGTSGNDCSGLTFRQTANIAYSYTDAWDVATEENNFTPIGGYGYAFRGTFDGQGYTISGIRVYKDGSSASSAAGSLGLFGYVDGGTVKNVVLRDAVIRGYDNISGLVGYLKNSTVADCFLENIFVKYINSSADYGIIADAQNGTNTITRAYCHNCAIQMAAQTADIIGNVFKLTTTSSVALPARIGGTTISATMTTYDDGLTLDGTQYYTEGATVTFAYNGTVPSGYWPRFTATNDNNEDKTAEVIDGTTLTMPGYDITLYAKLMVNTYTVTLDNQDATTAGSTEATATYGAAMPAITVPAKTGYTFGGYYTETNGGGTQYYNADGTNTRNWDIDGNATLYAKWTVNTYTVTLDNQDATTAGSASVTATYGAAMPTITVPTKTGYTFGGYYTETNGGGTQYYNADGTSAHIWDIAQATTLYAKWTVNTYTVTLNNRGATTAGSASVTATYGAAMPTITVPTKTGYTFGGYYTGYYTEVYSGGTQYYNADGTSAHIWDIAQAITLYAKWTANSYTVTLDNQDATTAGSTSATATYAAAMPAITVPTKTGYAFGGYYTEVNGGGTQYYNADGTSAKDWGIDGNTTLYAYWIVPVPYVDADGNTRYCFDYTLVCSSDDDVSLGSSDNAEGWYVVSGDVTITGELSLWDKNVYLILCDGATLTVNNSDYSCISASNNSKGSLTIYGQTLGTGTAHLTTTDGNGIYSRGDLTITGGIINVAATNNTAIYAYNVTIMGGSVNATGNTGISARIRSNIYLGWRNASDRIKATDYTCGNLIVIAGQSLTDGTDTYSGMLTDAQRSAIAGKTLSPAGNVPVPYIDADGKDAILAADGFTLITSNSGDVSYGDSGNAEAWYVVSGSVTIGGRLTLQDQCANIVLCDNATLSVSSVSDAVAVPNGNVNIFVQSGASGTANLTATADGITATGSVALHGGNVTVQGSEHGISASTVTLGCHTTANRITVSSYNGTVTIKSGQTLTDGSSAAYSGTLTAAQVSAIAGKMLLFGVADVPYIDGDGKAQVCPAAIPIESSDKNIYLGGGTNSQGWYVVNGDVTINGSLWLNDQAAHLILCDGATLTVSYNGSHGAIYPNGSLTLYGQSECTGSVVATNTRTSSGYGIEVPYDLTIHGGNVSATGNSYGIYASNITFGWSNPASSIYANSYWAKGTMKVKDGQAFTNDTNVYYGTLTTDQRTAIAGQTLVPYGVTVAMNTSGIRTYASPYALDLSSVNAYVISDYDNTNSTLTLTNVTEAPANTGLLLKAKDDSQKGQTIVLLLKENAAAVGTNLLKPVLSSETIVPQTDGLYTNFILANGNYGIDWYTLSEAGAIGANKAYLQLLTSELPSLSRGFTWEYEGGTTGIDGRCKMSDGRCMMSDVWYDLSGRKVANGQLKKGIYIVNGKKVIIK